MTSKSSGRGEPDLENTSERPTKRPRTEPEIGGHVKGDAEGYEDNDDLEEDTETAMYGKIGPPRASDLYLDTVGVTILLISPLMTPGSRSTGLF